MYLYVVDILSFRNLITIRFFIWINHTNHLTRSIYCFICLVEFTEGLGSPRGGERMYDALTLNRNYIFVK
ncbi:hypothetical protein D3C86_1398600 [compost metagenome]